MKWERKNFNLYIFIINLAKIVFEQRKVLESDMFLFLNRSKIYIR